MKILPLTGVAAIACIVSACGTIRPAEMLKPASLRSADTTQIVGIGGGEAGRFAAGAYQGAFSRSTTKLSFFGIYEMRDAGAAFSLAGPDIPGGLEARCAMKQRTVSIDIVAFKPRPLAYVCDFTSAGQAIAARFEIQESEPGLGDRQERRGSVMSEGAMLSVSSVHEIEGGVLPTAAPIGYLFERNGTAVGGVELNGDPVIFIVPGLDAADRRAILLASLAVSVFWDPATLED